MVLVIRPMPSISQVITSPSFRKQGGSMPIPTPAGVPVIMIVPAGKVMQRDPSQTTWTWWEMFCFGMLDLAKRTGLDCTS